MRKCFCLRCLYFSSCWPLWSALRGRSWSCSRIRRWYIKQEWEKGEDVRKEDGKNVEVPVHCMHGWERRYMSDRRKEGGGSIFTSGWCRGTGNVIGLCVRAWGLNMQNRMDSHQTAEWRKSYPLTLHGFFLPVFFNKMQNNCNNYSTYDLDMQYFVQAIPLFWHNLLMKPCDRCFKKILWIKLHLF